MEPNYVAKKSLASAINILWIIGSILIVPFFIMLYRIIEVKRYRIEFYDDKVLVYSGVLNVNRKQVAFTGVVSVSVSQSLRGQIYNYGNVEVDCAGSFDNSPAMGGASGFPVGGARSWGVDTTYIKNPLGLEEYLQTKAVKVQSATHFVQM